MASVAPTLARDDREVHLLTRGNVDGIVSAAILLRQDPRLRVSFVPSGDAAVDVLRKDLNSKKFILVDLGLTQRLVKTLHDKSKLPQTVTYLDHHQMSQEWVPDLPDAVDYVVQTGQSAARVAYDFTGRDPVLEPLVSIADHVEYCHTPELTHLLETWGKEKVDLESRILDFSWRLKIEDDRFRYYAAKRFSEGRLPSDVTEVRQRYLRVLNEGRWQKAVERVQQRMILRHEVGLLDFGSRKPSLYGFGSRALSHVAKNVGATVACMLHRRNVETSLSLRHVNPEFPVDLGRFAYDFTQSHGIVGGGHPYSAGAKIPTSSSKAFVKELYCLV